MKVITGINPNCSEITLRLTDETVNPLDELKRMLDSTDLEIGVYIYDFNGDYNLPEWEKAKITRNITVDDIYMDEEIDDPTDIDNSYIRRSLFLKKPTIDHFRDTAKVSDIERGYREYQISAFRENRLSGLVNVQLQDEAGDGLSFECGDHDWSEFGVLGKAIEYGGNRHGFYSNGGSTWAFSLYLLLSGMGQWSNNAITDYTHKDIKEGAKLMKQYDYPIKYDISEYEEE